MASAVARPDAQPVAPETFRDDIYATDEREREIVYTGRRLPVGTGVEREREAAVTARTDQ